MYSDWSAGFQNLLFNNMDIIIKTGLLRYKFYKRFRKRFPDVEVKNLFLIEKGSARLVKSSKFTS
jgi:hypothetical protein